MDTALSQYRTQINTVVGTGITGQGLAIQELRGVCTDIRGKIRLADSVHGWIASGAGGR